MTPATVCKGLLRNLPAVGIQLQSTKRPTVQEFEAWRQVVVAEAPRLHDDQSLGSRVAMVSLAWRIHHHHHHKPDFTHVDVGLVRKPWRSLESLVKLAEADVVGFVRKIAREFAWVGLLCEAVYTLETLLEELPKCPVTQWPRLFGPARGQAAFDAYLRLMGLLEALEEDMALHPGALVDAMMDYDAYRDLRRQLCGFFSALHHRSGAGPGPAGGT